MSKTAQIPQLIKHNLILISILLFALVLRLPFLNGSFWLDEAAQALESTRPFSQQLDIIPDFQPPLLHFIVHFASYFSYGEWWLRLWGAVIPGLITIWATYKIGERLFSKNVAILSSLLMATSSFHIFFSQELRPYSLPTMWGTLSTLLLVYLFTKTKKEASKIYINKMTAGYITLSLLGLFSSYLYPFFLIAQTLFLLILLHLKSKTKISLTSFSFSQILILSITIILLYLPWLPMFFKQLQAGQLLRTQMPNWETVVSISQLKTVPLVIGKFIFGIINIDINTTFIAISASILILLTILFVSFCKKSSRKDKIHFAFLFFLLFTTLFTSWFISFWIPVVRPKRLLMLMPILYLCISAIAMHSFSSKKIKRDFLSSLSKISSILLIILLSALNIFSLYQLYTNPTYQREDWRDLHAEISRRFSSEDTVIVVSYPDVFSPWEWYDRGEYDKLPTGYFYIHDNPDIISTLKPIDNYSYVLVFDYLRDLTDPSDTLTTEIEQFGYTGIGVIDRPNIGFVRIYAKEKPRS